jgi:hypothetical protein
MSCRFWVSDGKEYCVPTNENQKHEKDCVPFLISSINSLPKMKQKDFERSKASGKLKVKGSVNIGVDSENVSQ